MWPYINQLDVTIDGGDNRNFGEQVHTNYFMEDAKNAFNLFQIARVYITIIPREIMKHRRVKVMKYACRDTLLKQVDSLVKRLASVVFPTDGPGLYGVY